jgi:hypothetical protein
MEMKVVDGLSAIRATIHDDAIPILQLQLPGQILHHDPQVAEEVLIRILHGIDRRDFLPGNDQYMGRRLGIDIAECQTMLVLVHDIRWDFAINDPFEDGFGTHTLNSKEIDIPNAVL